MTQQVTMPKALDLGKPYSSSMGHSLLAYSSPQFENPNNQRTIMGYVVPTWQRDLVWTTEQSIAFLQSAWLGLPLGTYSYNEFPENPDLDGLLIDGQQRLWSVQQYIEDAFPVFGAHYSELCAQDKRRFKMQVTFATFVTATDNEDYLREYYNRMNFGGTQHTADQRA